MIPILPLLLALTPDLSKTSIRQLHSIIVAMLAMTGRITQLGISRWTNEGASYRTVHRFFHTKIDWPTLQWSFFEKLCYDPKGVYLLAGDESVITKSGKCTFGLDRFFSSLYDKPDHYISGVLPAQGVRLPHKRGDCRQNPCGERTCGAHRFV